MRSVYSVAEYLNEIRAIRLTGSATAETSFYPPVDRLFNSVGQKLKPPILFSTQLRDQGAGMPDGGFFPQPSRKRRNAEPPILQNPERGVVEIKPADYSLDALTNEPQTIRYLKQYGLVLITNLREFRLLRLNPTNIVETLERHVLARTPDSLWDDPISSFTRHDDLLPDFLARVMLYRAPLAQPKDVAWLLASYAREARARAEDHPLGSFHTVKIALQESLGIKFEGDKVSTFFAPRSSKPFFTESSPPGFSGAEHRNLSPVPASTGGFPLTTCACRSCASSSARSPIPERSILSNSRRF